MKTLILYETKMGFTQQCAETLHNQLKESVMQDIHDESYDLNDYDTILVGSPIYIGELEQFTKRFFIRHKPELMKKKLGIFCAGMNREEFNLAVQNSLPPDIFYHANIVHCGGQIDMDKLSFKQKFTIRRRLGIKENSKVENPGKIDEFVKWVQE
jgi:menaquinone-dependent protoporphyrinogen oxidase